MGVTLSPALVTGVILFWLVRSHAKPGWIALFGIMFAVSAGSLVTGIGKQGSNLVTRGVGQGITMANETVNGGGGPAAPQPGLPEVQANPGR